MGNAKTNKLYRTFVKGLVTEASYLTYPEDSSLDELNTVPSRKGNRTRRLGFNYEKGTATNRFYSPLWPRNEFMWLSVASQPSLNFLVTQNENIVNFYDRAIDGFDAGRKSFVLDLRLYARPGFVDSVNSPVKFASGKGYLFVVNENIEPLVITYVPASDSFVVTKIAILARDFEGLQDNLQNDEEPTTLTAEHHYNLQNQGWVSGRTSSGSNTPISYPGYSYNRKVYDIDSQSYETTEAYQDNPADGPIFKFQAELGRYPGNNKQWWVARAPSDSEDGSVKAGDFQPKYLDTLFSGNNRAPRGHYILNQFRKDRAAASGISTLAVEDSNERPNSVSFFSGRAWYGASSTVYYSQILDTKSASKAGLCYQEADPTAEDISDLIASDGGVIPIPEADHIEAITPLNNGIMVFANNGVWFISGGNEAFTALNISVSKVSPIGTKSPQSIVETDGTIFWWSEIGIQAIQQASGQFGPIPNKFGNTNIAETTIQTFYNDIGSTSKHLAKGILDTRNSTIYWLYSTGDSNNYEYDGILAYDMTLQAFYPWRVSGINGGPVINGFFLDSGFLENDPVEVEVGDGESSVIRTLRVKPSAIHYLVQVPGEGVTTAQPNDANYVDWRSFDGIGLTYESYIVTGYEINNDAMRDKQITYLFAHFRQTEDEVPSSCLMTARWDWAGNRNTNKWSRSVEVYRPRTMNLTDVVVSKNKVRGNGKSVQFKFGTSERGRTFDLLGWSVGYSGVTQP